MLREYLDKFITFTKTIRRKQAPPEDVLIAEQTLFQDLSNKQKDEIHALMKSRLAKQGELIFHEGKTANNLYIIHDGSVEVFKKGTEGEHRLTILHSGSCFGELALLDEKTRSASIKTLEDTNLLYINKDDLNKLANTKPSIHATLLKNIGRSLCDRLRNINEVTVRSLEAALQEAEDRVMMGIFMTYCIFILSSYTLLNGISHAAATYFATSAVISIPFLIIASIILFILIYQLNYPLSTYGLTLKNLKPSLKEAVVWSIGLNIFFVGLKIFLMRYYGFFQGDSVIVNPFADAQNISETLWVAGRMLSYCLFIPLQELIMRSGFQTSLLQFLPKTNYYKWLSIVITGLVFSAIHSHLSINFALLVFGPGILWGYLFAHHRNLIGVSVSHILIGWWALFFLGMREYMIVA